MTRCGLSPCRARSRPTVAALAPAARAIERVDHCVASGGVVCVVRWMMSRTFAVAACRAFPSAARASFWMPSMPSSRKRRRHKATACRRIANFSGDLLVLPSLGRQQDHPRRCAKRTLAERLFAAAESWHRCSSVRRIGGATRMLLVLLYQERASADYVLLILTQYTDDGQPRICHRLSQSHPASNGATVAQTRHLRQ